MLYIPKIDDYLEILTNDEGFCCSKCQCEYFKSIREEQNLRKTTKSL